MGCAEQRAAGSQWGGWPRLAYQFGDAKIGDLYPATSIQQDVLRLNIAMENAFVVGELERLANLGHHQKRLGGRKPAQFHRLAQIHPIHEFHQQIEKAPRLPKSYRVTMFEWFRRASMRPSRINRSANAESPANDWERTLSATRRSILG